MTTVQRKGNLNDLPEELLVEIISYLYDRRDWHALSAVSHRVNSVANRWLYGKYVMSLDKIQHPDADSLPPGRIGRFGMFSQNDIKDLRPVAGHSIPTQQGFLKNSRLVKELMVNFNAASLATTRLRFDIKTIDRETASEKKAKKIIQNQKSALKNLLKPYTSVTLLDIDFSSEFNDSIQSTLLYAFTQMPQLKRLELQFFLQKFDTVGTGITDILPLPMGGVARLQHFGLRTIDRFETTQHPIKERQRAKANSLLRLLKKFRTVLKGAKFVRLSPVASYDSQDWWMDHTLSEGELLAFPKCEELDLAMIDAHGDLRPPLTINSMESVKRLKVTIIYAGVVMQKFIDGLKHFRSLETLEITMHGIFLPILMDEFRTELIAGLESLAQYRMPKLKTITLYGSAYVLSETGAALDEITITFRVENDLVRGGNRVKDEFPWWKICNMPTQF